MKQSNFPALNTPLEEIQENPQPQKENRREPFHDIEYNPKVV